MRACQATPSPSPPQCVPLTTTTSRMQSHTHTHTHTHTHRLGVSQTKFIRLPHSVAEGQTPGRSFSPRAVAPSTLFCPLVSVPIPLGQFFLASLTLALRTALGDWGSPAWPPVPQLLWPTCVDETEDAQIRGLFSPPSALVPEVLCSPPRACEARSSL